jgi:hypothetical protein
MKSYLMGVFLTVTIVVLPACLPKEETIANQQTKKTMISIEELANRSGIDFGANALVIEQTDHLGKVQQAQSWIVKTTATGKLPSVAEGTATLKSKELLSELKSTVSGYDFGEPLEQQIPSYFWVVSGSSWEVNMIRTSTGHFSQVKWIKQPS